MLAGEDIYNLAARSCWAFLLLSSVFSRLSFSLSLEVTVQGVTLCFLFSPVFVTLTCAFRYGREDLDVLGLTFRKDLFVANVQAFPPPLEEKKSLTRLQERLIKKLGEHAHPFTFEVLSPTHSFSDRSILSFNHSMMNFYEALVSLIASCQAVAPPLWHPLCTGGACWDLRRLHQGKQTPRTV